MELIKKEKWDTFVTEEGLDVGFDVQALEDEDHTHIYRTAIDLPHLGRVFMYVLLDTTIYSTVRFVLAEGTVSPEHKEEILAFVNRENPDVQAVKLYVQEGSLYLDTYYMATNESFDPTLLLVVSKQVIEYISSIEEEVATLLGIETITAE